MNNDEFGYFMEQQQPSYILYICIALCAFWVLTYVMKNVWKNSKPPALEEIGRSSWTLLHTMAAKYPVSANRKEEEEMKMFLRGFARFFPCGQCSNHMSAY